MARKIALTQLNASTIDIINTIRANASAEYQSLVPDVETAEQVVKVGDILYGTPSLANQFLTSLINRIALVHIKSANFYNKYAELKKGYLEYGETVEEVFVQIAKAREFSPEKASARELKRTVPDVRTAFHSINWKVQYPVTIQNNDLRQAFMSINGVEDLIARIVQSVYTANEYDEFLLFKYLLIKGISKGKLYPVAVGSTLQESATSFRGMSNKLEFMSKDYNDNGVHTTTPKSDQYIFMSADFNANYDINVLASAFNMDKAEFMGKLMLIDNWDTFDNERFDAIRTECTGLEEVTQAELNIMKDVQAVLIDKEWIQFYDNLTMFSETYVASGLYWNYFLNIWKTISSSPFSNAIVFVNTGTTVTPKATYTLTVDSKVTTDTGATLFTLVVTDTDGVQPSDVNFVQDETSTKNGIAVHKYGAVIIPDGQTTMTIKCNVLDTGYTATTALTTSSVVGDTITLSKNA